MIFHEIYGCYYQCVSKILAQAVKGTLTDESMKRIVAENTFSESFLTILPAFKNQEWQLIDEDLKTPLKYLPSMPLTTIQLRWLKSISLDPRIQLFRVDISGLESVHPLFTIDDYVVFDKYNDGDSFDNEAYINHFHTILDALHERKKLFISYKSRKGGICAIHCIPNKLEYSEKDDKFRLYTTGCRYREIINLGRIESCTLAEKYTATPVSPRIKKKEYLVIELIDERNALERVMLHFAHFEKQAEKLSEDRYRMTIYYDRDDETELVIRVLSFGPMIKVTKPERFVGLIKERLYLQKNCILK